MLSDQPQPDKNKRGWDNTLGASAYPIDVWTVFKLTKPKKVHYKGTQVPIESAVYVWIIHVRKPPAGVKSYDKKVRVIHYYWPTSKSLQHLCKVTIKNVQLDSLTTAMRGGYEVLSKKTVYNRAIGCWRRFYRLLGAYQCQSK